MSELKVALMSSVSLRRNLEGRPFVNKMCSVEKQDTKYYLNQIITHNIASYAKLRYIDSYDLTETEKYALVEKQLVEEDFLGSQDMALWVNEEFDFAIIINYEDHLRIHCNTEGLSVFDAYQTVLYYDEILQDFLNYAFDERYGYLTASTKNAGTGLCVRTTLHVPMLVFSEKIKAIEEIVSKKNLMVAGRYGKNSVSYANTFQVSSLYAIGYKEEEMLEIVHNATEEIVNAEVQKRNEAIYEDNLLVVDAVNRSYGLLKYSRLIGSQEASKRLSFVRMGIEMGIITNVDIRLIINLIQTVPLATFALLKGTVVNDKNIDRMRADLIREELSRINY